MLLGAVASMISLLRPRGESLSWTSNKAGPGWKALDQVRFANQWPDASWPSLTAVLYIQLIAFQERSMPRILLSFSMNSVPHSNPAR